MNRRRFIRNGTVIGSSVALSGPATLANSFILVSPAGILTPAEEPWFDKSMRWAQLAFVENDPGRSDPGFWLNYFKRVHADGALLSAAGVVAFYPTDIPLHHRSAWLGNSDLLGEMVEG